MIFLPILQTKNVKKYWSAGVFVYPTKILCHPKEDWAGEKDKNKKKITSNRSKVQKMKHGIYVYNKWKQSQEMTYYMCFLMNLATVYFAHHKTHHISQLQFHLNGYKEGTYSMLMLGCFGDFGILSTSDFKFVEKSATIYDADVTSNISNDSSIGLWMFIFENIHNYILPDKGRNNFQAKTHNIIYILFFTRARLFPYEYVFK